MPYQNDMAMLSHSISDNLSETPDGFLVCHNVRIARTGPQDYLGSDIGLKDRANDVIKVYRTDEEVFAEEALMSFEGKPVTYPHPPKGVTPDNAASCVRGTVRNVRQDGKYMIADLVIYDAYLIGLIKDKRVREVSCGYTVDDYEPFRDGFKQVGITGNHVAVVERGRAGSRVAIVDHELGVKKRMKLTQKQAQAKMLAAFAKDASDEEMEAVLDAMNASAPQTEPAKSTSGLRSLFTSLFNQAHDSDDDEKETKDSDEEKEKTEDAMPAWAKDMKTTLDALVAAQKPKTKTEDADFVDSLFASDEDAPDEKEMADEETEEEKKEANDAALQSALVALKPVLATLPTKQQQMAKDAIRAQLGKTSISRTYAKIAKNVQEVTQDAQKKVIDYQSVKEEIDAKFNPHHKAK